MDFSVNTFQTIFRIFRTSRIVYWIIKASSLIRISNYNLPTFEYYVHFIRSSMSTSLHYTFVSKILIKHFQVVVDVIILFKEITHGKKIIFLSVKNKIVEYQLAQETPDGCVYENFGRYRHPLQKKVVKTCNILTQIKISFTSLT